MLVFVVCISILVVLLILSLKSNEKYSFLPKTVGINCSQEAQEFVASQPDQYSYEENTKRFDEALKSCLTRAKNNPIVEKIL